MAKQLTPKQLRFITAYIETGNASEAYRRAYDASRMKANTIGRKAGELLQNGLVAAKVDEIKQKALDSSAVTIDRLVGELSKIAFTELPGIVNYNQAVMSIEDFERLTPAQRACIKKFKLTETKHGSNVEVELHDKLRALELLGRYQGMFVERHSHNVEGVAFNFDLAGKGRGKEAPAGEAGR